MKTLNRVLIVLFLSAPFTGAATTCPYEKANSVKEKYSELFLKLKDVTSLAPVSCSKNGNCIEVGFLSDKARKSAAAIFAQPFTIDGCLIVFATTGKIKLLSK
jgi:hypothetical protein